MDKYGGSVIIWILFPLLTLDIGTEGSCNYPTYWQNKVWTDNIKEQISIGEADMTGWEADFYSTQLTEWICFTSESNLIVSRSRLPVSILGTDYFLYMCMLVKEVNQTLFVYYLMADDNDPNVNNERIKYNTSATMALCDVCSVDSTVQDDLRVMTLNGDPCDVDSSQYQDIDCTPCSMSAECQMSTGTSILSTSSYSTGSFTTFSTSLISGLTSFVTSQSTVTSDVFYNTSLTSATTSSDTTGTTQMLVQEMNNLQTTALVLTFGVGLPILLFLILFVSGMYVICRKDQT